MESYLNSVINQFKYYKSLGDKTFEQISEEHLFWKSYEEGNSISIIVNHLNGNMLSRWTNFLTEDGEKEWRQRDQEFEEIFKNKEKVLKKWNEGWNCLFNTLNSLTDKELESLIYIRNQGHTVIEAINRQLCHYAYHVGQIVLIGKQLKSEKWKSLSIPKGASKKYNQEKFSKAKERKHFTSEYIANNEKK